MVVSKITRMTFPVYRYHPAISQGPGRISTLKLYESPEPVTDNWAARKLRLNGNRLGYLNSPNRGTDGLGLLRSWEWLCIPHVVPGGILDADGRHIPILNYYGAEVPRSAPIEILAGFAEILGLKYTHRFEFGEPEQLNLDDYKSKLIDFMGRQQGFPRPINLIKKANSFLEVMFVEFGESSVKRFYQEHEVENWSR